MDKEQKPQAQTSNRPKHNTGTPANQVYAGKSRKNNGRRRSSTSQQQTQQQRLEFAEICDMKDGSRQLAVNGRHKGPFIQLNKKRGAALNPKTVRDKLEQLCAEQDIDPGSNSNLKKCARDAFVNYQKQKRKQEQQQKEQERQAAKEKEALIELTPDITKEVTFKDIDTTLETTIKKDEPAKLITFCGMLNAQTEDDQFNVGYQEQSSSGKSYIPLEVSAYFPSDEVIDLGGATPTAFAHEQGEWDYDRNAMIVILEGKIMIFIDMPDYRLLQRLRPMLSHDKKEIQYKATDKSERQGLRTKTVFVRGYPSVFFCTTSTDLDEQESTRLMLVSPETTQEKIDEALRLLALRRSNFEKYRKEVLNAPQRIWLSSRINAIRQTKVRQVIVPDDGKSLYEKFKESHPYLLARHQRDFPRIICLIKAHALLNVFNREKAGDEAILATQADIDAGLNLYGNIESSNELGLSPYTYRIYEKAIKPILEPNVPLTRKDIRQQFFKAFRRTLGEKQESSILSQLEAAGLILQDVDPNDKRKTVIFYPTHSANISPEPGGTPKDPKKPDDGSAITKESLEKYIRQMCGVNTEKAQEFLEELFDGKREKHEESVKKNVGSQVASGDNNQTTPHTAGIYYDDHGQQQDGTTAAAITITTITEENKRQLQEQAIQQRLFLCPDPKCDEAFDTREKASEHQWEIHKGLWHLFQDEKHWGNPIEYPWYIYDFKGPDHSWMHGCQACEDFGFEARCVICRTKFDYCWQPDIHDRRNSPACYTRYGCACCPTSPKYGEFDSNAYSFKLHRQSQKEEDLPTYFACPLYPSCEQQLEGPANLLEHIYQHCPEREASTREWLQARGLLPEEEDDQPRQ
jgi:hypothetical protein